MLRVIRRVLLGIIAAVLVILVAVLAYLREGRGPVEFIDVPQDCFVEKIDGTRVVHLSGTPYELGYAHGKLLRKDIREITAGLDKALDELRKEKGIPRGVVRLALDFVYKRTSPYIPDRYKREMEGLADAAGVSLRMIRWAHVVSEITERGCSSFAVFGPATVDGKLYHGRNFDWAMELGLQDRSALFIYHPDGQIAFASVGYIGSIGCLSGINIDRVSISQIGAVTDDKRLSGIPLMFLLRRILEECRNLEDATALIQGVRRTVGYNYVIADGKVPNARAFETTANYCAVFTDDDPKEDQAPYAVRIKGAVFRADEAIDQTVRKYQRCANGYPNMPYGSNSHEHRYKGMAARITENYRKIDANIALEILRAVAMRNVNLHSVLCSSTDLEMWVAHARGTEDAWKQPYVHYDLKELFNKTPPAQPAN